MYKAHYILTFILVLNFCKNDFMLSNTKSVRCQLRQPVVLNTFLSSENGKTVVESLRTGNLLSHTDMLYKLQSKKLITIKGKR
jgi:hypothetical protein